MAGGMNYLYGLGVGLTILGILFAIGAVVLATLKANATVNASANAVTIIGNAEAGLINATSLLGVLGLISIAGAVIVVGFGMFGSVGGGSF